MQNMTIWSVFANLVINGLIPIIPVANLSGRGSQSEQEIIPIFRTHFNKTITFLWKTVKLEGFGY